MKYTVLVAHPLFFYESPYSFIIFDAFFKLYHHFCYHNTNSTNSLLFDILITRVLIVF